MTSYRRLYIPGATYFFTVVAHSRTGQDLTTHADLLKRCIRAEQHVAPFAILAAVLLPDAKANGASGSGASGSTPSEAKACSRPASSTST